MLQVGFDWIEFTVLKAQLTQVSDILGLKLNEFSELSKGRFGYQNQLKWKNGHVYVLYTKIGGVRTHADFSRTKINSKMGVHVMITGQGCRQYSSHRNLFGLIITLSALENINFSRIDLALDDKTSEILDYTTIYQATLAGFFTSRWSKWDEVNSRRSSDNSFLGRTMYFGSQASDLFCRIYDKSLERKANANEEIPTKWTRLELVYRKDRATKLVDYLIKEQKTVGEVLRGTLKQYLRFLIPSTDQNKSRWPTATWWDELLQDVEKLQLTIKKEARTIEDMITWVDKQISPTLSAIIKAQEGDLGWLRQIIVKGSERLTRKHKDAINEFLAKEGLQA